MAGFVIGSTAGVGLAIVAGLYEPFRRYIQPYILVPQVTPRVALTPILIAWLGFGWSPKIAIAALICFFPPFVNTVTGMLSVDEDAKEMFRSLGASKSQIFWKLQLPSAMPIIMAGLKIAMSLALAGAIVGCPSTTLHHNQIKNGKDKPNSLLHYSHPAPICLCIHEKHRPVPDSGTRQFCSGRHGDHQPRHVRSIQTNPGRTNLSR